MADSAMHQTGTFATALRQAGRLLAAKPDLAEVQAREILAVIPGNPQALIILGQARAAQNDLAGARDVLRDVCESNPDNALAHAELGIVLARLGDTAGAIRALERAVALSSTRAEPWREL